VYGLSVLVAKVVFTDPPFWLSGHVHFAVFGMSLFSVVFGWYVTLPLGIAAAALVESLERRREATAAKAAG
jgi:hypothetical protein